MQSFYHFFVNNVSRQTPILLPRFKGHTVPSDQPIVGNRIESFGISSRNIDKLSCTILSTSDGTILRVITISSIRYHTIQKETMMCLDTEYRCTVPHTTGAVWLRGCFLIHFALPLSPFFLLWARIYYTETFPLVDSVLGIQTHPPPPFLHCRTLQTCA